MPPLAEHRARITRARDQLAAPQGLLHKVVLARALQLTAETALDPRVVLRRLMAADPTSYGYLVDLTAAGDCYTGAALVGASPSCWSPDSAIRSPANPSPAPRHAPRIRRSTPPTRRRWPVRPRTNTSINW
ncbi:chorismate binding enzyme family protein [Mycobacterium ulcerans str. Harvey]|uniref:Chorismate binding enzyme family protein n=1 Tax=Mycobacterium ulcerans str. Harvey TaxID=1299332 RepID=A0ABN0QXP9_MYCUL|nr:chorismate binding enzyme family protein [Mycobacterium ulcerans str. Harvey]